MTAVELMDRSPKAVIDFLLEMYARQTGDEQSRQGTGEENGIGFNKADARFMSSCAEQAMANRRSGRYPTDLSDNQIRAVRKTLCRYARQLTEILAYHPEWLENVEEGIAPEPTPTPTPVDARPLQTAVLMAIQVLKMDGWTETADGSLAPPLKAEPSPYGTLPPTQHHSLPAHLRPKDENLPDIDPVWTPANRQLTAVDAGLNADQVWDLLTELETSTPEVTR